MSRGLIVGVALIAAALAAAAATSDPPPDPNGDAMRAALDRSGLPEATCAAAWNAYESARDQGADEQGAFTAALSAVLPADQAKLVAAYVTAHGGAPPSSSSSSSPTPSPTPTPSAPSTNGAPPALVAQTIVPPGGWTGGRAILARDIPISDWLADKGWPEGKPISDARLVAGGTWYPRDALAVDRWLTAGELRIKDDAFSPIELKRGADTLVVYVANSATLLGADTRLVCSILAAQMIADALGCILPTCEIVDAAWRARVVSLPSHPIPPTNWMCSVAAGLEEDRQVFGTAPMPAGLTATWGKDYVMHPDLFVHKDMACIYGWHRPDGSVWQSGGNGGGSPHPARYFDYSHTFRLVSKVARLNGSSVLLGDLYKSRPDLVGGPRWGGRAGPARHPLVKELPAP